MFGRVCVELGRARRRRVYRCGSCILSTSTIPRLYQVQSNKRQARRLLLNVAPSCGSGTRALARSQRSRPNLAPGPTSTFTAQRPTTRIRPDALVTTLRIPSSGVISIAHPEYLPLDIYEPDNDYRKSSHDPHHVHFRRCQRTLCPSKRLPRSLTRPCGTFASSRDGTTRLMVVFTGPPMVRTRIRRLLRCLPPALIIRCR